MSKNQSDGSPPSGGLFSEFPSVDRDEFGLVLKLSDADIPSVGRWRLNRDRLMLQSIVTLLLEIVKAAVGASDMPEIERESWLADAETLSRTYLEAMKELRLGTFA